MANLIKRYTRFIKKQLKKKSREKQGHHTLMAEIRLMKGLKVVIRSANREDAKALYQMHAGLSKETLFFRYFMLRHPDMAEMEKVCRLSPYEGAAFVAQIDHSKGPILGLAYYQFDPGIPGKGPELAMVVDDQYQGHGVGKALLQYLCRHAAAQGCRTVFAAVHPQNVRMRRLLQGISYPVEQRHGVEVVESAILLKSGSACQKPDSVKAGFHVNPFVGLDLGLNT
jgi:GNAT superfamily N-acetyltransferase